MSSMRAIDTHAHLDFPDFDLDRAELIVRLEREEIGVINIATDLESSQKAVVLAQSNPLIWATTGLHPTDVTAKTLSTLTSQLEQFKEIAKSSVKVVAIGEVGLDYHQEEFKVEAKTQAVVLRQFLTLAGELNLPVVFHCREAYGDLVTILADYPGIKGVIHCFTGVIEEAKKFLDLGLYISFTATITYPANEDQRLVVKDLPLDRIMLETDCPFLSPQSKRGTRNDPTAIFEVAKTIAEVKNITEEEVLQQTTTNAESFFGLTANENNE